MNIEAPLSWKNQWPATTKGVPVAWAQPPHVP
jgi:hypothetical protein